MLTKQSFVRAQEIGPLLKNYIQIDLEEEMERIFAQKLQLKAMRFNGDLRSDFLDAVRYAIKFL